MKCTFTGRGGTVMWAKTGDATNLDSRVTTGLVFLFGTFEFRYQLSDFDFCKIMSL